jgi:hypothetical protein
VTTAEEITLMREEHDRSLVAAVAKAGASDEDIAALEQAIRVAEEPVISHVASALYNVTAKQRAAARAKAHAARLAALAAR